YDALVAAELASAARPLEHPVPRGGDDFAEVVDSVRGSQCEAEMNEPRGPVVACRTFAAIRPLEQLQADAAKVQHAGLKTGSRVPGRLGCHPSELQVEVAEGLDIVGREGDVLYLGDRRTDSSTTHRHFSSAALDLGSQSRAIRPGIGDCE